MDVGMMMVFASYGWDDCSDARVWNEEIRLARLAAKVQVLAVTHAPQVAARAGQHLLISKDALDKGKRVATRVNALAADHRREEIARMLAGAEITAEARAAAERLLKAAS